MEENEVGDDGELLVVNESYSGQRLEELPDNFDNTALVRDNMPGTMIHTPLNAAEEKSNASSDDFDSDDDNQRMGKRKRPNYHASFMVERSPISKQSSRNKNKEIEQIRSKALSEKQARTSAQVHQNGQTGGHGSASEDLLGGRWVNEKLAHHWRNRKSALKTKYYESRNDEETIIGLKNEVGENQWDWLVKFWESEKGQNQMNELVNQQRNASKYQIVNQVVGEHTKSNLTYGHGIRRVDVFGTQSFRNESLKMLEEEQSRRKAAENELKNMQEEMNGVKSTLAKVLKYV
ncbi:hypothetical protein WN943_003786 [Citrus x changshan-huyou]